AWDRALAVGYSRLELMLLERALHGVEKVVVARDGSSSVMREYAIKAAKVSDNYRLSGAHRGAILAFAKARFRRVPRTRRRVGDLLLLRPGAAHWHLGIWTGDGLIHADIVSRRIVERPGPPDWPVAAVLRPRARAARGD
ncbi:MAG: hypothetical protein LH466_05620, partial [Sphingomonas bacterium]|nr:hypothetical protein [Sphingomonas bacterium]